MAEMAAWTVRGTTTSTQLDQSVPVERTGVRNIVSRFEQKPKQSLDALPFRTVRSFFNSQEQRSIHVTAEKQKYDALTEKQRLERSPELVVARKRLGSGTQENNSSTDTAVMVDYEPLGREEQDRTEELQEVEQLELVTETNQQQEEQELVPEEPELVQQEQSQDLASPSPPGAEKIEEVKVFEMENTVPTPPPPPLEEELDEEENTKATEQAVGSPIIETPEQETRKRPMLTTELSFVMEEDHTIETEDMVVVGERFSTDGEDDRDELLLLLERELRLTPEDEAELCSALESIPSPRFRAKALRRVHKYEKPENVPSKLFVPTAASLASRTTKSPNAPKREPRAASKSLPKQPAAASAPAPTRRTNKYANIQSKVKQIINAPPASVRKGSTASADSDVSQTSQPLTPGKSPSRRNSRLSTGVASVDRQPLKSNTPSRRSSGFRSLKDLHGDDVHSDWEGRHRGERLSFASSTSSTDSMDPAAYQLAYTMRKSRYENVTPRYLDFDKSSTYVRNKESQRERRNRLAEANAAKSVERQKQLKLQQSLKEKREQEDKEATVRRGAELHSLSQALREMEKQEEAARRKSLSATRRALNGTGTNDYKRTPTSSIATSSPRTSVLSESDSIPSSVGFKESTFPDATFAA